MSYTNVIQVQLSSKEVDSKMPQSTFTKHCLWASKESVSCKTHFICMNPTGKAPDSSPPMNSAVKAVQLFENLISLNVLQAQLLLCMRTTEKVTTTDPRYNVIYTMMYASYTEQRKFAAGMSNVINYSTHTQVVAAVASYVGQSSNCT